MSQKTNPISLRLQHNNKQFESCWYSDFYYDQVLGDEIQLDTYVEGLLYQAGRSQTTPSLQSQYKRYCTLLFFFDQRAERHKREYSLKISREPAEHLLLPRIKYLPRKTRGDTPAVWDGLLFNKVQSLLLRESLSREEVLNRLLEEVAEEKRLGFTQKSIQEYVFNYAINGSSLEQLLLSGFGTTRLERSKASFGISAPAPDIISPERESRSRSNDIINPGLKHNPLGRGAGPTRGSKEAKINLRVDNCLRSKGLFCLSMLSFALSRVIPYTQEAPFKAIPLAVLAKQIPDGVKVRAKQSFRTQAKPSLAAQFGFCNKSKAKKIAFLKNRAIKESSRNIFSAQEEGRENIFRGLVIDHHSQSTQNRLSFFVVKGFENQLKRTNGLSLLDHKSFKTFSACTPTVVLDKSELKNTTSSAVPQKWRAKPLGLARHIELFLNTYSGNFGYHTVQPVRAVSPYQSAGFLLESVVYLLQRKCSFRQIKDDIFRELDRYKVIKGARLSCAGRLGGRSKKAQKAKTQSAQWGETSLNVFSSRLAFASKGVNTTYGKVGVKLWLCYTS